MPPEELSNRQAGILRHATSKHFYPSFGGWDVVENRGRGFEIEGEWMDLWERGASAIGQGVWLEVNFAETSVSALQVTVRGSKGADVILIGGIAVLGSA